jgi:cysteine synthase
VLVREGITGCIGNTPILRTSALKPSGAGDLLLKLEGWNASGSVKARAAERMISQAEERGDLAPDQLVVEPSSGNLGLALAMVLGARGRSCALVVDPRMTAYSEGVMEAYGARVERISKPDERGSWQGSRLARARELQEQGAFLCYQYGNPDNPAAHYEGTGPEILEQLGQAPTVCVVGVSTGGQVSGIGRRLKEADADCRMVAVDVVGSSIFGGRYTPYRLRGLGLSWWPDNLDARYLDDAYRIDEEFAFLSALQLARHEGVCSGGAAGAIVAVAVREALVHGAESTVLAVIPERGDRYLAQFYDRQWLADLGYVTDLDVDTWVEACGRLAPVDPAAWRDGGR